MATYDLLPLNNNTMPQQESNPDVVSDYGGYGNDHHHHQLLSAVGIDYHHFYQSGVQQQPQQPQQQRNGYLSAHPAPPHGMEPTAPDNYDPYPDSLDFPIGKLAIPRRTVVGAQQTNPCSDY